MLSSLAFSFSQTNQSREGPGMIWRLEGEEGKTSQTAGKPPVRQGKVVLEPKEGVSREMCDCKLAFQRAVKCCECSNS